MESRLELWTGILRYIYFALLSVLLEFSGLMLTIGLVVLGAYLLTSQLIDYTDIEGVLILSITGSLGIILIGGVTIDVYRRVRAKHALLILFEDLSDDEVNNIRNAIGSGGLFASSDGVSRGVSYKFQEFLFHHPFGEIASDALFQRSRSGRMKYFDHIVSGAKARRNVR